MPRLDGPAGKTPASGAPGGALCTHPLAPWPPSQPLLNELTGNRPDTGARQDVPVGHTQLQPVVCLFQLLDHLLYKLDVAGAVADKGIKSLRHLPWVQRIRVMVRALWKAGEKASQERPRLGDPGPGPHTNPVTDDTTQKKCCPQERKDEHPPSTPALGSP